MRKSRKSEFFHGFVKGMKDAFNRNTFLSTLESAEANQVITIKARSKVSAIWEKYRLKVTSLDDAYTWGLNEGEQAWENNEEVDEVVKMAKLSVVTK